MTITSERISFEPEKPQEPGAPEQMTTEGSTEPIFNPELTRSDEIKSEILSESDAANLRVLAEHLHHEATTIIGSRELRRPSKVTRLATLAINVFGEIADAGAIPKLAPEDPVIKSYVALAEALSADMDDRTIIDIDMLDELVDDFVTISPISVALLIERIEIQHRIPRISTLAIKLWVFNQSENRNKLTTHFDQIRKVYIPEEYIPPMTA